ncbi:MAG: FAD-binding domain-containing protein [Candidatus Puniceispirillaceae bacterium]
MSLSFSGPFAEADAALQRFLDKGAASYEARRNFDYGPADRSNVSELSKFISHRVLFEYDVARRALAQHRPETVDKFIQEVFWRIYWKGWLEHRPAVWNDYVAFDHDTIPERQFQQAVTGKTGIDCFDYWSAELQNTNYLHNHARMWFASIWIFTLGLPWQAGARFFMQHLFDGDAASNTLGWRWVAGIQTSGKHYVARASNIEQFTNGRFSPHHLNETPLPVASSKTYDIMPLDNHTQYQKKYNKLIILENDLYMKSEYEYDAYDAVFVLRPDAVVRSADLARPVIDFKMGLVSAFCEIHANAQDIDAAGLRAMAASQPGFDVVYPAIGDHLDGLCRLRDESGVALHFLKRPEDLFCWQYATKGFFNFKKHIPDMMSFAQ